MMLPRILFIVLITYQPGYSQDADFIRWSNNVNWDGVRHWRSYLKMGAGFMGPNALPVPPVSKGRVGKEISFQLGFESHFSDGDHTQTIIGRLTYPIVSELIQLEFYGQFYEWFRLDEATKDERLVRFFDDTGGGFGDIYFGASFQVVKDKSGWPDLMIRMVTRAPTGEDMEHARFTDTPGYYFDLSAGKNLKIGTGTNIIRLYGMAGFYAWQLFNSMGNRQDDALLVGNGVDFIATGWTISTDWAGYFGYIDEFKDDPVVYRFSVKRKGPKFDFKLGYQLGLQDFDYQTIRLSVIYHVASKFIAVKKE